VETNPSLYRVVMENDRVRILEYRDRPGDRTIEHSHPDSVMVTMSAFRRRLEAGGGSREVDMAAGEVRWLDAQAHIGENVGESETHVFFVELKEPSPDRHVDDPRLGPSSR
jgi:hypothetical protein